MRIIDSHIHLIDVVAHDWYPALEAWSASLGVPGLYASFGVADHRSAAGPDFVVDSFVHVSATTKPRAYLDELAWVDQLATTHSLDLVAVGTVDPTLPTADLVADLEAQAASARFRGVRVLGGLEPASEAARTILSWLDERDLVFDLVTNPDGMDAWLRSLQRHPGLRVVLEHTGWPASADDAGRAAWDQAMSRFAAESEAPCKLSGLGMVTMDLSRDVLAPWLERTVELLGWDRLMFGSNMPIESMGGSLADLLDALDVVTKAASVEERERFWGANAAALYRL